MIKLYLLIALVSNDVGQVDRHILDFGLTADDCIAEMWNPPIDSPVDLSKAILLCQGDGV